MAKKLFKTLVLLTALFLMLSLTACETVMPNDSSQPDESGQTSVNIEKISNFDYSSVVNFNKDSGGYLAEANGAIYFLNPSDNYKLYRSETGDLTECVKLSDLGSDSILGNMQLQGNKLYYLRTVRSDNAIETEFASIPFLKQIICYDISANTESEITELEPINDFTVCDDKLFYTSYDTEQNVFGLYDADGGLLLQLDYLMNIQADDGKLFMGFNESLVIYDIQTKNVHIDLMVQSAYAVSNSTVYFVDLDNGCLNSMSYDSENHTFTDPVQLSDKKINAFNLYGNKLLISCTDDNAIYEVDTKNGADRKLSNGTNPIITSFGAFYITPDGAIEHIPFA